MEELDMSGVDPLRFAEMRRPVDVLKQYLALERRTYADKETYARRIGVGTRHFEHMVTAWRRTGRAGALSGATAAKGSRKRSSGRVPPEARTIVADVIATSDRNDTVTVLEGRVAAHCAERNLKPPSRSFVWAALLEARAEAGEGWTDRRVLAGTVTLALPVSHDGRMHHAEVMVAVRAADGRLLAYEVAEPSRGPDEIGFAGRVCPLVGVPTFVGRRELSAALGRRIGRIRLLHEPALAKPAVKLLRSRQDTAPDLHDAMRAIAEAMAGHAAERDYHPPALPITRSWRDGAGG